MAATPLNEFRTVRLAKVTELRSKGINPYPSRSRRTHYAYTILSDFQAHEGKVVTVAGRLMSWRKQGALAFSHIQDQTARIQLFLKRNAIQPLNTDDGNIGYDEINLLDLGDIVEATGTVIRTQRGEISVLVEKLRILTKAIRPLPDQWSGLKDRDQILRKRYLDTILEQSSFKRFSTIAKMVAAIRSFLGDRGFIEIHTPVLQPQYGGGTAKPFKTHVNALSCDMYLAISHELYLKRLIVGGYDKVFTIGRYFRNEGIDRSHHPEFSMVETMTAFENYEYNMTLVEDMFRHIAVSVFGRTTFIIGDHQIDFQLPWRRVSMADAVFEKTNIDFRSITSVDKANEQLAALGVFDPQPTVGEALASAFGAIVEKHLIQPTLVYGHPVEISPLAKPLADDPRFAERFEIFIAGLECGDNWSEQNDPVQLLDTWKKTYRSDEKDTGKFHTLDFDFVEAMEYGMPPTTGIGPGIERMAMIFTEQENIDDVIFFPLRKPTASLSTISIYDIEESSLSPEVDAVLLFEDFESLCLDGVLKPHTTNLTIQPHLRIWRIRSPLGRSRASGHVEISGFFSNNLLRLAGYKIKAEDPLTDDQEKAAMMDMLDATLRKFLQETFPQCQIALLPATITRNP